MFRQGLALAVEVYGEANPSVADTIEGLAAALCEQERFDEAEPLLRRALDLVEAPRRMPTPTSFPCCCTWAGCTPPARTSSRRDRSLNRPWACATGFADGRPGLLAGCLLELGDILAIAGEIAEAEALYRQALEVCTAAESKDQPAYREALRRLAGCLHAGRNLAAVEPLAQEILERSRRAMGEKHPEVAEWARYLAGLYQQMGQRGGGGVAVDSTPGRRACAGRGEECRLCPRPARPGELLPQRGQPPGRGGALPPGPGPPLEIEGEDHPDVAESLHDLGELHHEAGDAAAAEPLYRKAVELRRVAPGETSVEFAFSLHDLALIFQATGRLDEAESMFRQALEIVRDATGEQSPGYLLALHSLALLFQARGNWDRAEADLRRALGLARKLYGKGNPQLAPLLRNLARLYGSVGDYLASRRSCKSELDLNRALAGQHAAHAADLANLALPGGRWGSPHGPSRWPGKRWR